MIRWTFSIIGFVFVTVASIFVVYTVSFLNNSIETEGVVVELRYKNGSGSSPIIEYNVPEKGIFTYYSSVYSNPPMFRINQSVIINYKKDDPRKAKVNSFFHLYLLPLIFGIIGSIFFSIGIVAFIFEVKLRMRAKDLMLNGTIIRAKIIDIIANKSIRVNNKSPYNIYCEYVDNAGNIYKFKSENLWKNPEPYLNQEELEIYVDPLNFRRYYIDVEFLK